MKRRERQLKEVEGMGAAGSNCYVRAWHVAAVFKSLFSPRRSVDIDWIPLFS